MPFFPMLYAVVGFGVASWAFDKVLKKVTGRNLEGNLDAGLDNVIELFPKKTETVTMESADTVPIDES